MSNLEIHGRMVKIYNANHFIDYINLDSIKAISCNSGKTKVYLGDSFEVSFSSPTLEELLALLAE